MIRTIECSLCGWITDVVLTDPFLPRRYAGCLGKLFAGICFLQICTKQNSALDAGTGTVPEWLKEEAEE